MLTLLKEYVRDFQKDKESIRNLLLFLALTCIMPLFTLGNFSFSKDASTVGSQPYFYDFVKYYPGVSPSLYLSIPLSILYLFLFVIFYQRIRENNRKEKMILCLLFSFLLIRLLSILSFPYGSTAFEYVSPFDQKSFLISYDGFSASERITGFLYDSCFYSYFAIFFLSIKKIANKNRLIFHLIYLVIELFVLVCIVFSLFTEFQKYIDNFVLIFIYPNSFEFNTITSFVLNRNIYGFFLMIGCIFLLAEFLHHENIPCLLLFLVQCFLCLIIKSKTPFLVLSVFILCLMVFYPIFHFRKHKGYSILFLSAFAVSLLYFFISYFFFKDTYFKDYILPFFHQMTNWSTMNARKDITRAALSMLNTPYFIFFGYSRYPFMTIFGAYNYCLPIDHSATFFTHNSFADILMDFGLFGLLFMAIFFALIARKLVLRLLCEKKISYLKYIILFISMLVYSYSEPRFLLLEEGSALFFVLMLSFPYVLERDENIKAKELS